MKKNKRVQRPAGKNITGLDPGFLELAPIRFIEYPLKVEIVEPAKEKDSRSWLRRNLFRCIIIPILIISGISLLIWMRNAFSNEPVSPVSLEGDIRDICIGFTAPSHVIKESEHNIDVTVLNNSNSPFNGTVILAFSQVSMLSIPGDGETYFKLTDLPAQAQVTRRIGFILNEKPPGNVLDFQLKVLTPGNHSGTTGWQSLQVESSFILKFIKDIKRPIFSIFIGLVVALLIEIVKYRFFNN